MRLSFEKDEDALKQAIADTEERITKLKEHQEVAKKQSQNDSTKETLRRLDRNLDKLEKKLSFLRQELDS